MFLHFWKTWLCMIFMIFCYICFSLDCLCLLASILDAFWYPFWYHFRVLGCPDLGWFSGSIFFIFFYWFYIENGSRNATKSVTVCRARGGGRRLLSRSRFRTPILRFLNDCSLFLTLLWTPAPPKHSPNCEGHNYFSLSHSPSQYRMTSIYGLT